MCYFDGVKKVSDTVIPRRRAIQVWKGFDKYDRWVRSPYRREVKWTAGTPKEATRHGFYAMATRRGRTWDAVVCDVAKRVLIWGRIREYNDGDGKHGYRAQFCMIPKPTRRKK